METNFLVCRKTFQISYKRLKRTNSNCMRLRKP